MADQQQRRSFRWMIAVAAIIAAAGCAADDDADSAANSTATATVDVSTGSNGSLFTADGSTGGSSRPDTTDANRVSNTAGTIDESTPTTTEIAVVESLEPVAETGVPGIDDDDDFCRAWSEFAGSFSALAFAWQVHPPEVAARLEVTASDALNAAVAGLAANLPSEIDSNREVFINGFTTPLLRRAERARGFLVDAGAGDELVAELGDAWIAAITDVGTASESLVIDEPDGATQPLAEASARFAAELPSILEDPSLDTTEFDISPSIEYISENCPDQGTLAGNDEVSADGV